MLVRAPKAGARYLWGDVDGEIGPAFDELPEDFAPFA